MAVYNLSLNLYACTLIFIILNTVISALEQPSERPPAILKTIVIHLKRATNYTSFADEIADILISKSVVKRNTNDDLPLQILLKNGSVSEINLKLTDGILANKDTPVWDAEGRNIKVGNIAYTQNCQAMTGVGDFSFYQNYEYRAAVTVFHDLNIIMGNFAHHEFKRNATIPKRNSLVPNANSTNVSDNGTAPSDKSEPNGKLKIVYPELLVILDENYVRNDTRDALMKALAYWNSVDMIFSDLKLPQIKLHIAGIVMPMNDYATPWIIKKDGSNGKYIDIDVTLEVLGDFFVNNADKFPDDSYDFVINLVSTQMHSVKGQKDIEGISYLDAGCDKRKYRAGLVNYMNRNPSVIGAHVLGRLLSAPYDAKTEKCKTIDGIMRIPAKSKSANYWWSECSRDAFSNYFDQTKSACLENRPKTIHKCEENISATNSSSLHNDAHTSSNGANSASSKSQITNACSMNRRYSEDMKQVLFYSLIISSYLCKTLIFEEQ